MFPDLNQSAIPHKAFTIDDMHQSTLKLLQNMFKTDDGYFTHQMIGTSNQIEIQARKGEEEQLIETSATSYENAFDITDIGL